MKKNWQRQYRITFGVPLYEKDAYLTQGSLICAMVPYRQNPTQDPPQNATVISNIPSDGNSLRGFDFSFESSRDLSTAPTKNEKTKLVIKNLSPEMYKTFNTEGCLVKVEAGYLDTGVFTVYQGFVDSVLPRRGITDIEYIIMLKEANLDVKNSKVSIDFPETDDAEKVLQALVKLLPSISQQQIDIETMRKIKVAGGFSFEGKLADVIVEFCKAYNIVFSMFNGKFVARYNGMVQGDPDYNNLKKNTFVLNSSDIKDFNIITDNSQKLSKEAKIKHDINVSMFLTNITFDNFITVTEDISKDYMGTYQPSIIKIRLNTNNNVWDTVITGSSM
jgi:hypothetical protein